MSFAISSEIDPVFCAIALRTVTDELARSARRPGVDDTVQDILPGLSEIAARGRTLLANILDARYPDVDWGGDEMERGLSSNTIDNCCWIYDPIDGAYHYIQGLPLWSASLALVKNGEVVLGLVYDPTTNEMFTAQRGAGTTLNGQTISISDKRVLRSAVVGTGLPIQGHGDPSVLAEAVAQLADISRKVFVVRQMASASLQLAYVAAGRLDAYWETGYDLHDWASGALLVREAGGCITDFEGQPFEQGGNGILAGPEHFVDSLRDSFFMPATGELV